jgi:hypothetical protein
MNNLTIKKIIKISLEEISFEEQYTLLCKKFNDFENSQNVKSNDVKNILVEMGFLMKSSAKESLFYKDYQYKDFCLRFILSYKNGIINCSDLYWNEDNSIRIYGGFSSYLVEMNSEVKKILKYLSPISTNDTDLKKIILKMISIHISFLELFSFKMEKYK